MKLYKIKKSKIDNRRGLYASKDIKKGTKIINYINNLLENNYFDLTNFYCSNYHSEMKINQQKDILMNFEK